LADQRDRRRGLDRELAVDVAQGRAPRHHVAADAEHRDQQRQDQRRPGQQVERLPHVGPLHDRGAHQVEHDRERGDDADAGEHPRPPARLRRLDDGLFLVERVDAVADGGDGLVGVRIVPSRLSWQVSFGTFWGGGRPGHGVVGL
jgi:hypothetical protein